MHDLVIIGGGAAGLMAADRAAKRGLKVLVLDSNPSFGRKLLMAGKSGLNLSKDEPIDEFMGHYSNRQFLETAIRAFGPKEVRLWAEELGEVCFIGTSGRLYPKSMKASPLLRSWLNRMVSNGVEFLPRTRFISGLASPIFETDSGLRQFPARAYVFALGGASWPRLGTNGAWAKILPMKIEPLRPANMGFNCSWSAFMESHFGAPIKNIRLISGPHEIMGEILITNYGLEGGAIYSLSSEIECNGAVVDLCPRLSFDELKSRSAQNSKSSQSNRLRRLGLSEAARALYFECREGEDISELKSLKLPLLGPRAIDEAISTRGGISFEELDANFQAKRFPNIYFIGEMLDWSAPTGGYLLTACLAMGAWVGEQVLRTKLSD